MLERPEIPLNTNASENDIRVCVTKRKVSGGTVSENGRIARDVMLGLAKTCAKLKVSFFDYLGARLEIPGPRSAPPSSRPRFSKTNRSPGNLPRLPHLRATQRRLSALRRDLCDPGAGLRAISDGSLGLAVTPRAALAHQTKTAAIHRAASMELSNAGVPVGLAHMEHI